MESASRAISSPVFRFFIYTAMSPGNPWRMFWSCDFSCSSSTLEADFDWACAREQSRATDKPAAIARETTLIWFSPQVFEETLHPVKRVQPVEFTGLLRCVLADRGAVNRRALGEGLYALVSLRFNGLSRGELAVNMQFRAQPRRSRVWRAAGSGCGCR